MALKLYLVTLLSSALIIYSEAQIGAITGPPATEPPPTITTTTTTTTAQPQRGQSTIENFWPNKCEKKSKRSAGNKGGHSDSSDSSDSHHSHSGDSSKSLEKGCEGKKTICAAWAIWKTTFGGTCKANSVCSLQIQNSYVGKTFFATRAICQGGCPQGFQCKSTDKAAFCAANKGAYACLKGAFTSKGSLVGLSTCQSIPTQPPTPPTFSITFPQ